MADTSVEDLDELLRAVARTPVVAPFGGTERYRVVRCLGEGGCGVVYEVIDHEIGRTLALKTLKPSGAGFSENIRRLKNEFRSVADLVHPNLVGLHELATDGTRWFFTMDLVRGGDFLQCVHGDEARLRNALGQLVHGVAALHRAGILHRDLKPSNVLIEQGRVVILDFGLAGSERVDDVFATQIAGTPSYMAPEQFTNATVGGAADWYAVGVMLYEALTGAMPFPPGLELPAAKLRLPTPPSRLAQVPPDLETLCLALLRPDPSARPHVDAIIEQLGAASPAAPSPSREQRSFVGRAHELDQLRAAFAVVRTGSPQLVQIAGEPGVGKSSLLVQFLDEVHGDAAVLAARCHEREAVPFKAFDGIADALVRYFRTLPRSEAAALMPRDVHLATQLFPVLDGIAAIHDVPRRPAPTEPREIRARAFHALKELLGRMADKQPLVIAIDDLQWGDLDSARLLAHLVSAPEPPALLLVLCYRSDDAKTGAALRETLRTLQAATSLEISLAALPDDDALRLAAELLGPRATGERARTIAKRGEGHPLFIAELARAEQATDQPASLMDILWQRVARLSRGARELLEMVAVAGQPLPAGLCFEAAGLQGSGIDALRTLRAEQLVRTGDTGAINVFHDRIRDTILERADAVTRRSRHLALARTLERSVDSDFEALAYHFDAADERAQAGRYALLAGDAAMRALAFDRAAALYQMAIDRSAEPPVAVLEKLADALLYAGSTAAAGRAYLAAAERTDGAYSTTLFSRAGEHLLSGGELGAGLQALERALADVGETLPATLRKSTFEGLRHFLLMRLRRFRFRERHEDKVSADELLRLDTMRSATWGCAYVSIAHAFGIGMRFSRHALRAGEPRRAAFGLLWATFGLMAQQTSFPPAIDEMFDAAEQTARRLSDPNLRAMAMRMRAQVHMMFGNFAVARDICESAAELISDQCRGMAVHHRFVQGFHAMSALRLGDVATAKRLGDALLADAVERGDAVVERLACVAGLVHVSLAADDAAAAEAYLAHKPTEDRCGSLIMGAESIAAYAKYVGRPRDGVTAWRDYWARIKEEGLLMQPLFHVLAVHSLVTSLLAEPDGHREIREAERLTRSIRKHEFAYGVAAHHSLEACLAVRAGRTDRAAELLRVAAEHHEACGALLEAAACRYRRGELTGDERETRDASELLHSRGVVRPERWVQIVVPTIDQLRGS